MEKFRNLGLSKSALNALAQKGFEEPTEIQEKTIPVLLESNTDIIAQAQTGTGKTAAFGLVFIEKLSHGGKNPQALVLTPTRELAIQVTEEINSLKGENDLIIVPIYGGQSINLQNKQLKRGVDVIVGTPGRILDHLRHNTLNLGEIKYLVLDEADEMLNMGFIDDIEEILKHANKERRMLLFSATMPSRIMALAKNYMPDYKMIQAKKDQTTTNLIDQIYFEVRTSDKFEALCRIIDIGKDFYGIIFCRTKVNADLIAKNLIDRGYSAEGLHGDIAQNQRERNLKNFRNKKTMILVATDVAARGIDVNNLTHVINYCLPQDPESYIHRIGRTGRAGNEGTAITFVTPEEYKRLSFIKRIAKAEIRKEEVPDAEEVISIKKERISSEIQEIVKNDSLEYYKDLVDTIIGDMDEKTAIAALLKYSFADELDISAYSDIKKIKSSKQAGINIGEKTRLFITIGKKDSMTPKKLVDLIERSAGVKKSLIRNVDVFETYSFVTVPFEEAELILENFKKNRKGRKIVVEKASSKKGFGKSRK